MCRGAGRSDRAEVASPHLAPPFCLWPFGPVPGPPLAQMGRPVIPRRAAARALQRKPLPVCCPPSCASVSGVVVVVVVGGGAG